MKLKRKVYRQGDVLIERVESVPRQAARQKSARRIVLALGEATGHHHALEAEDPADWWKDGEDQYVALGQPAELKHEEHATISLPTGVYRVTRQREYSPEEIRRVAD